MRDVWRSANSVILACKGQTPVCSSQIVILLRSVEGDGGRACFCGGNNGVACCVRACVARVATATARGVGPEACRGGGDNDESMIISNLGAFTIFCWT